MNSESKIVCSKCELQLARNEKVNVNPTEVIRILKPCAQKFARKCAGSVSCNLCFKQFSSLEVLEKHMYNWIFTLQREGIMKKSI